MFWMVGGCIPRIFVQIPPVGNLMTTHAGRLGRSTHPEFARKLKPRHQEEIRAKIQAIQLINALNNHATGKKLYEKDSQVTAALALLKKILPDMRAIDMKAEGGPFDGLDDDELNELLFEALRGLREMHAVPDAELIIRRISKPVAEPVGEPAGSGTQERSTGPKGGESSADSERVKQEAVRTARSSCTRC